jgi:predicted component of type VI protein secretion system
MKIGDKHIYKNPCSIFIEGETYYIDDIINETLIINGQYYTINIDSNGLSYKDFFYTPKELRIKKLNKL